MGRADRDKRDGWCILRTAGPRTMRLTTSLQEAGFEAWTPTEHIRRRVPRGKSTESLIVPLAPTYVFARADRLGALQRIERADITPHPRFSIFRHSGDTVFVRHAALHPLRGLQQDSYLTSLPNAVKHPKKPRGEMYDVGDELLIKGGPFSGFKGFVESSDGLTTELVVTLFGRGQLVKVSTLHLRRSRVLAEPSAA